MFINYYYNYQNLYLEPKIKEKKNQNILYFSVHCMSFPRH